MTITRYYGIMYLSEERQKDLVHGSAITSDGGGERRWAEGMTTVVRDDDGKFYRIFWDRGLTEDHENEFTAGDVSEVFPVKELRVNTQTFYLTDDEQQKLRPTLTQKLEAEAESYAIATGKDIREPITDEIYDLAVKLHTRLAELAPLDLAASSGNFRQATQQYLSAIINLKDGDA